MATRAEDAGSQAVLIRYRGLSQGEKIWPGDQQAAREWDLLHARLERKKLGEMGLAFLGDVLYFDLTLRLL